MNYQYMKIEFLIILIISLIEKNTSKYHLRSKIQHSIQKQLAPFKDGITEDMLSNEIFQQVKHLVEVNIINNKITTSYPFRGQQTKNLFQDLARELPDLKFFYNDFDEPRVLKNKCQENQHWKQCACDQGYNKKDHGYWKFSNYFITFKKIVVFGSTSIPQCFLDIILPSLYHAKLDEYNLYFEKVLQWDKREFKIFWRGASTGGYYGKGSQDSIYEEKGQENPHFSKYHRHKLVTYCKNINFCDAKFSFHDTYKKQQEQMFGMVDPVDMKKQQKYKILIDIDGNTYSGRFPLVLSTGAAIFKMHTFQDIGTLLTEPWLHYIPVNLDLSDLEQKIEWAKNNDEQLERIAKRGRQFAISNLRYQIYYQYTKSMLLAYYQLLQKGRK